MPPRGACGLVFAKDPVCLRQHVSRVVSLLALPVFQNEICRVKIGAAPRMQYDHLLFCASNHAFLPKLPLIKKRPFAGVFAACGRIKHPFVKKCLKYS